MADNEWSCNIGGAKVLLANGMRWFDATV